MVAGHIAGEVPRKTRVAGGAANLTPVLVKREVQRTASTLDRVPRAADIPAGRRSLRPHPGSDNHPQDRRHRGHQPEQPHRTAPGSHEPNGTSDYKPRVVAGSRFMNIAPISGSPLLPPPRSRSDTGG